MLVHIRPWEIFEKLGDDRQVSFRIPPGRGTETETVSSLDTLLLIAAARIVKAEIVLELGTGKGCTTLNLARNTDAFIHTCDKKQPERPEWENRDLLRIFSVESDLFNLHPTSADMVFCDINYTPESIAFATDLAFACDPKVIAWHDFNLPHVAEHANDLSESTDIYHVEDSNMAFWFREKL